jgi:hypothetical protein
MLSTMRCELIHVPIHADGNCFGSVRAVCKCITHNFMLDYPQYDQTSMCPIGRIEAARDEALALIEEANK